MTHAATALQRSSDHEVDDINDYIAALTQEDRDGLIVADAALDLSMLLDRARERPDPASGDSGSAPDLGPAMAEACARAGVLAPLTEFRRYLRALGYDIELNIIEVESREHVSRLAWPSEETN